MPSAITEILNRVAPVVLWANGVVLLGIFTRSGSSAFILGLPVLYYLSARIIAPRLKPARLLAACLLLTGAVGFTVSATAVRRQSGPASGQPALSAAPHSSPASAPPAAATGDEILQTLLQRVAKNPADGQAHYQLAVFYARQPHGHSAALRHAGRALAVFEPGSLWHRRSAQLLDQLKEKHP